MTTVMMFDWNLKLEIINMMQETLLLLLNKQIHSSRDTVSLKRFNFFNYWYQVPTLLVVAITSRVPGTGTLLP